MVIRQGEIWWIDFDKPYGTRPVIVIQADNYNRSKINSVIVAMITSNLSLADAPGNVLLPESKSPLEKDSVVNISQIFTVSKEELRECQGSIPLYT